jgi:hypothetical protein
MTTISLGLLTTCVAFWLTLLLRSMIFRLLVGSPPKPKPYAQRLAEEPDPARDAARRWILDDPRPPWENIDDLERFVAAYLKQQEQPPAQASKKPYGKCFGCGTPLLLARGIPEDVCRTCSDDLRSNEPADF